ncbi:MAG: histidinol-phosphate transaminase [Acidobacteriota bacterium]
MSIADLVRPNIIALEPYHSAREKVQEGVLLDANENPYTREWEGIRLNRYPDPYQRVLRTAIAGYTNVPMESILAGAGSDEVLDWIFKVFCRPGRDRVATAEPTYGMYRVMAEVFGVGVFEFPLNGEFKIDADQFLRSVPSDVKVLFLCSPNNPTGNLLDAQEVLKLCREWGKIVVLDEAYVEFAGGESLADQVRSHPNLIIMRTLSKAFGRAALRLGYAIADPEVIGYFMKVKAPYNLGSVVQKEGQLALNDLTERDRQVREIQAERGRLEGELKQAPEINRVFPSQANFLLFRCAGAREVYEELFRKGIVVRDRSNVPELEDCIRVSVGTPAENDLFLQELRHILKERGSKSLR